MAEKTTEVDRTRLAELADEYRRVAPVLAKIERKHKQELARVEAAELHGFRSLARKAYAAFCGDEEMAEETVGAWCAKVQKLTTPSHHPYEDITAEKLEIVCSAIAELRGKAPTALYAIGVLAG